MAPLKPIRVLALALMGWAGCSLGAGALAADLSSPGAKGAQVYCYMRSSGNSHEVSWIAAYALIKRQSASLFKTSPEHAAVMITEAVVQNPGSFPDCGKYLGDLYTNTVIRQKEAAGGPSSGASGTTAQASSSGSNSTASAPASSSASPIRTDRYAY